MAYAEAHDSPTTHDSGWRIAYDVVPLKFSRISSRHPRSCFAGSTSGKHGFEALSSTNFATRLASEHQSIAGYLTCRICIAGMGTRHQEQGCMANVGIEDDSLLGSTATAAVLQRCGAHITRLQGEPRLE